MIYEFRSYQVEPENVPEFERRFGQAYPDREAFSPLAGFWRTTDGPCSEVVHVWPYRDLAERTRLRALAAQHPNWPPATGSFVNRMMVELVLPFDFVQGPQPGSPGPFYEIRYDYFRVCELRAAGEAWSRPIQERSLTEFLVVAGRLEFGQSNGIVQIWARPQAGMGPMEGSNPAGAYDGPAPTSTVTKQLAPAAFSPLQ